MIPYVLQRTTSSRCKNCNEYVELLIQEGDFDYTLCLNAAHANLPAFFICFDCRKVFQAGVGELELIRIEE